MHPAVVNVFEYMVATVLPLQFFPVVEALSITCKSLNGAGLMRMFAAAHDFADKDLQEYAFSVNVETRVPSSFSSDSDEDSWFSIDDEPVNSRITVKSYGITLCKYDENSKGVVGAFGLSYTDYRHISVDVLNYAAGSGPALDKDTWSVNYLCLVQLKNARSWSAFDSCVPFARILRRFAPYGMIVEAEDGSKHLQAIPRE